MSTPPPSYALPEPTPNNEPDRASADAAGAAMAWLSGHAVFQTLTAGVFGGLITGWFAISGGMVGAFMGACAVCLVVPVFGWFIGLPLVLLTGMMVGTCWLGALAALLLAWACVALFGLMTGLIAQYASSRR